MGPVRSGKIRADHHRVGTTIPLDQEVTVTERDHPERHEDDEAEATPADPEQALDAAEEKIFGHRMDQTRDEEDTTGVPSTPPPGSGADEPGVEDEQGVVEQGPGAEPP
jgi:hypothetical protein